MLSKGFVHCAHKQTNKQTNNQIKIKASPTFLVNSKIMSLLLKLKMFVRLVQIIGRSVSADCH